MQTKLWPTGWFTDAARSSGGVAYNLAYGIAGNLQEITAQNQAVILNSRLQSSQGINVDLWVQDFFGPNLPRFSGESDSAYIARAQANLSAKKGTPQGVLTIAGYYGTASVVEPFRPDQMGCIGFASLACSKPTGGVGSITPGPLVYVHPASPMNGTQASQANSQIMAARPLGVNTYAYQVNSSNQASLL
jgi:hypothetical protein